MMKTMVCAFDNSPIAAHSLAYAQQLSRVMQSRLVGCKQPYVHQLFKNPHFVYSASQALSRDASNQYPHPAATNRRLLTAQADPVMQMRSIYTLAAFARKEKAALIVAGTETDFGFNDLYTDTIAQLIRQATCPLLLVPEGVTFKPIKQIVVVIEQEADLRHRFDFLLTLASLYQATVSFLQISQTENDHLTSPSPEKRIGMYLSFPYEKTDYFQIVHNCIPQAVREFVSQVKADLLVVIPPMKATEPYSYTMSHLYNEYMQESIAIPLLAIDALPLPIVELFINNSF